MDISDSLLPRQPLFRPSVADSDLGMRLLWFYTAATSSSFSVECGADRPSEKLLRTRIVRHAFETPFLMQSLLALSALHLQTHKQSVDPRKALTYRARSFKGYRQAIWRADPETSPGLICNSLFPVALSFSNFRYPEGMDLYIVDWIVVWRGIGLMIQPISVERLVRTGIHCLFYRPPINLEEAEWCIPDELLVMETYYNTLKYLGSLYHYLCDGINQSMTLRIISWITFMPPDIIRPMR
ncbi:Fungal Zn(2)-Cys(6) binuclear cluster domain [Geosmithia morbida]|uniref:Fungal Zn(2)-Cys(6) binuclear cluster domain n=1 Tax=Geosmithia morbida TaxID=1094350 RepID=A0A9P4YPY0_9HYPO|nr:Fungal Zn(2)-Cys(6) binuclear cluster domain [Geosmithia morbida]KAF4120966.1 Fungal Zn(2)-Cys(6) binuclear cluster domain [Geosmithia morbida]